MEYYRITKYNPKYRDKNGYYFEKDNWTEFSDVYEDNLLFNDYLNIEESFLELYKEILNSAKIDKLYFLELYIYENQINTLGDLLYVDKVLQNNIKNIDEKYFFGINKDSIINFFKGQKVTSLKYIRSKWENEGCFIIKDLLCIDASLFDDFFKCVLRNSLPNVYKLSNRGIAFRFSYNYYSYLKTKDGIINTKMIEKYESLGIYIEKSESFKSYFR